MLMFPLYPICLLLLLYILHYSGNIRARRNPLIILSLSLKSGFLCFLQLLYIHISSYYSYPLLLLPYRLLLRLSKLSFT
jgi:hypothetical protein